MYIKSTTQTLKELLVETTTLINPIFLSKTIFSSFLLKHHFASHNCLHVYQVKNWKTNQRISTSIKKIQSATHCGGAESWKCLRLKHWSSCKCPSNLCASAVFYDWFVVCLSHKPQIIIFIRGFSTWAKAPAILWEVSIHLLVDTSEHRNKDSKFWIDDETQLTGYLTSHNWKHQLFVSIPSPSWVPDQAW